MKTAALMIGALIVILLMPSALDAINDFRMTDYTNEFNITTGVGEEEADVTLSQALFGDETLNATVTSNITADAPITSTYTSATQVLNVTGLVASKSRRLTVVYKVDSLTDYPGAGIGTKVWPILLIIGVIGIAVGAVYNATRKGD